MADDNPEVKASSNSDQDFTTNAAMQDQENMEMAQNGHPEEEGKDWELTQTDKLNKSLLTSFLNRLNQQDAQFPHTGDEAVDTSGPEEEEFEDRVPSQDTPPLVQHTGPVQNGS